MYCTKRNKQMSEENAALKAEVKRLRTALHDQTKLRYWHEKLCVDLKMKESDLRDELDANRTSDNEVAKLRADNRQLREVLRRMSMKSLEERTATEKAEAELAEIKSDAEEPNEFPNLATRYWHEQAVSGPYNYDTRNFCLTNAYYHAVKAFFAEKDKRESAERELNSLQRRFDTYVYDSGTTCFPCPNCGHGMDRKGCLRCELEKARVSESAYVKLVEMRNRQLETEEESHKRTKAELAAMTEKYHAAPTAVIFSNGWQTEGLKKAIRLYQEDAKRLSKSLRVAIIPLPIEEEE